MDSVSLGSRAASPRAGNGQALPLRRPPVPRLYPDRDQPFKPSPAHWALCYSLFAVICVACFFTFWLWYATVVRVIGIVLWRNDWYETTYLASMSIVFVLLIALVTAAESHLRGALPSTYYPPGPYLVRLGWRFAHMAMLVVLFAGSAAAVQEWAFRALVPIG